MFDERTCKLVPLCWIPACADPEGFVRGGATSIFLVYEGWPCLRVQIHEGRVETFQDTHCQLQEQTVLKKL